MEEKIKKIREELNKDLTDVNSIQDIQNLKVKYLGKKGLVTELTSNMKDLSIEEKKEVGKYSNELKKEITDKLTSLEEDINKKELNKKIANEKIDITLPSTKVNVGGANILEKLIEDVEELYLSMGYDVVDGPELEKDLYNFESNFSCTNKNYAC